MKKEKTKTSSFGVSKREGHDATQFYTSNLYKDIAIDENQEIIDNSDRLDVSLFDKVLDYTLEQIKSIPDYSIHLAIVDLSMISEKEDVDVSKFNTSIQNLIKEMYRVLISGGKLAVIIDNEVYMQNKCSKFYPFHAEICIEAINVGFLMRGDIIWSFGKDDNNKEYQNISGINSIYQHILVFSKQLMKREKGVKTDTITRDQFLSYTKSIWKPQPELIPTLNDFQAFPVEIVDKYNHILQLYSFLEDAILIIYPESQNYIPQLIRKIRKNLILLRFKQKPSLF